MRIELQVYTAEWTPDYGSYDHPAHWEVWHPYSWMLEPTIQLSHLSDGHIDAPPSLEDLHHDTDAPHIETQAVLALDHWNYDLTPAPRDLDSAFNQEYPSTDYYGFRIGFTEQFQYTNRWRYTVAYD